VTAELLAGLLAGYSVAVPVGPMATYLVALTARTSVRVGAAAALGIATVDGAYAVAATLGGAAVADFIRPALGVLRWVSVAVLAGVAARAIWLGVRPAPAQRVSGSRPTRVLSPARAYATLAGLTAINPTTLIYFVALVVGLRAGSAPSPLGQALFVAAAFVASASWQLLLACGGALLGRALTGVRGQRLTALVSGVLIGALAVRLAVR
jgi:threonine/homoserine/homoserine lactone efflux protein